MSLLQLRLYHGVKSMTECFHAMLIINNSTAWQNETFIGICACACAYRCVQVCVFQIYRASLRVPLQVLAWITDVVKLDSCPATWLPFTTPKGFRQRQSAGTFFFFFLVLCIKISLHWNKFSRIKLTFGSDLFILSLLVTFIRHICMICNSFISQLIYLLTSLEG